MKRTLNLILFPLLLGLTHAVENPQQQVIKKIGNYSFTQQAQDSLKMLSGAPEGLIMTHFTGPDLTPSPACLAVAPTGELYVGVDMIGSLGKDMGKGFIRRFVDTDNDGEMDKHTDFARVDNPRGIFVLGDQVFVLHTTFDATTGIATGMDLVVFEDRDRDGVADGAAKPLVVGLSNAKYIRERGTDHATNGIRMGIDGWIYIAVGDFGFHNATGTDGKKLTMLGGGILRVRPDGTEVEVYTHGLRNIYDLAIDPYMNIFTRDNTNDGGGWDIRFSHQIQSGEYGYPLLFQNFTEEIIPALAMLGGGSGTGSLYMDEDTWPAKYNKVPMMADWGRSFLYLHHVTPDGPSFTQKEEEFIKLPQITDLDVDGSGRLYLAAWDGAGYSGNPDRGYVARVVPKGWTYKAFPDTKRASVADLANLLKSGSAIARLYASQELLSRPTDEATAVTLSTAKDKDLPLSVRVAAIYTYAQVAKEKAISALVELAKEEQVREFAFRALTDRIGTLEQVPIDPFIDGLKDPSVRVQTASIVALGRLGRVEAANALLQTAVPASFVAPAKGVEGPHDVPNAAIIPAHLAVRALVRLNAVNSSVGFLGTESPDLALWALRYMHDTRAVDGLIAAYGKTKDQKLKDKILVTLARLYKQEPAYDASWWWGTRPDSHGPYYKGVEWESSQVIEKFLKAESLKAGVSKKPFFAALNDKFRMEIAAFNVVKKDVAVKEVAEQKVDLDKIKNQKGQVGKTSIEDIMLALAKIKGDPVKGKALYTKQGCFACHSTSKSEPMKGPFMGQIGSIMNREQIAESILKPDASISQGFKTVLVGTKDKKSYMGFVTQETADKVVLRDIAGSVTTVQKSNIATRKEMPNSMMPAGLVNSLTVEEFASLVAYLEKQK
ncbi:c-type cytochrome [Sphingobacterium olei]|uniref:C-type cytochrome n=1 Tax=Sphingobacterium olei TaxID=2571155 RepID=A0A4U0NEM3_9SPHI|nr:c-type cytochrome [Sphingobacterium olei]TJZ52515.1 c-type cytochrome [Sphingobacterium olei]